MEIRPAVESDLEQLNDIYNHYVRTSPATFDIEPITMDARRAWFEGFTGPYRLFVAMDGEAMAGYAQSKPFMERRAYETSVTTSVYIADAVRSKGVGTRLYGALFESMVREDLHRAYAGISLPNPASVALHEKFGFKQVAHFTEQGRKFGKYWDVAWFEKEL